jgi:hypothetical protein
MIAASGMMSASVAGSKVRLEEGFMTY